MLAGVGLELAPSGYQTENASSNPALANEFFVDVSTVKIKLNLFNKGDIDVRIHEICTRRIFVIYSIIYIYYHCCLEFYDGNTKQ